MIPDGLMRGSPPDFGFDNFIEKVYSIIKIKACRERR